MFLFIVLKAQKEGKKFRCTVWELRALSYNVNHVGRKNAVLSPVHTSNNVEATFHFVAKNGIVAIYHTNSIVINAPIKTNTNSATLRA